MKTSLLLPLALLCLLPAWGDDAAPGPADPAPVAAGTAVADPSAPIDPVKEAEIRKMIEETGTVKAMDQIKGRMITMLKAQHSELPAEFWERMQTEMKMDELVEKLIPIYNKYYTLEDVKAINAFYESPVGRHMTEVRPLLSADSMQVGQVWGRELGRKLMEEIQKEKTSSPTTATKPVDK